MFPAAAFGDAAASELGEAGYIAAPDELDKAGYNTFRERRWVPAFIFLVDVLAIEASLYFGYLIRYALSAWWPVSLGPNSYEGLILGVLVLPD